MTHSGLSHCSVDHPQGLLPTICRILVHFQYSLLSPESFIFFLHVFFYLNNLSSISLHTSVVVILVFLLVYSLFLKYLSFFFFFFF